jgi:choline dehydrogenase-like flavoprotein
MLRDARQLDDAGTIECDLCIIGAGAAGITLARSFAGGPLRVCLLESGGLEYEPAIQDLYRGQNVGLPYFDLDICRLRFFGGSTNHWADGTRSPSTVNSATNFSAQDLESIPIGAD